MNSAVVHRSTTAEVITDAQPGIITCLQCVSEEKNFSNKEEKVFSIGTDLAATPRRVSAETTNSAHNKRKLITFPASLPVNLFLSLLLYVGQLVTPVLGLSQIATIAGNGETGYVAEGGPATSTSLNSPRAIWGDSMGGSLFISVSGSHVIRRIDFESNIVTTVVGTGTAGGSGNGPATSATLNNPHGLCGDHINTYYIADLSNGVIRAVSNGIITTVAGSAVGTTSDGDGGPATSSLMAYPNSVWISSLNVLYISDSLCGIRTVDMSITSNKLINVIVGTERLNWYQVWGSTDNQLLAGTYANHIVKRIQLNFLAVTTVAGTGNGNSNLTPGQATSTNLQYPIGVAADIGGVSYVSQHQFHTVRMIGMNGYMTVVVGTGVAGTAATAINGDGGPPTSARLRYPFYLFCDINSFIYIADRDNHKIRKLYEDRLPTSQPTTLPFQPTSQPSGAPTERPTCQPSRTPTVTPSVQPTRRPSNQPSSQPSGIPSVQPSSSPSSQPSSLPSGIPSMQPSSSPTNQPSSQPSCIPSALPNSSPSSQPSTQPSGVPSVQPSSIPISQPLSQPSGVPSVQPSRSPSSQPSNQPSGVPSVHPSSIPISQPSSQPNGVPSVHPSSSPSSQPLSQPSGVPSVQPSRSPSSQPSSQPSGIPSVQPSRSPSSQPSCQPSGVPSVQPSDIPTSQPSSQPSRFPSVQPSSSPTSQPASQSTGTHSLSPSLYMSSPSTITHSISVLFSTVAAVNFKTVLPYLYTSAVTGFGLSDVTVGRPLNGSGYVLLGSSQVGLNRDITTAELQTIWAVISYNFSGRSVAIAGDVNGDGHIDLVIGVPFAARVYVLFGTKDGFVNMTEGFAVFGVRSSDLTGWSVSGTGDVNNDTFADVIIGAPMAFNTGVVYVLYGSNASHSDVHLQDIGASNGFVIRGVASQDAFGLSVSGAGDVNGDGYEDIAIGALEQSRFSAGAVCVVFGSAARTGELVLTAIKSTEGRVYSGGSWSWLGYSVSGAGDVNGDHYSDVIVGSAPRRNVVGIPVSYLLFGNSSLPISGALIDVQNSGVTITGGGVVVAGVGDVNNDHFDDVMIVSDVDLSTGGGIVVQLSVALQLSSDVPTRSPSPTYEPSDSPTVHPTRPTAPPTVAPSGPTHTPTMTPTQPTSLPSAVPTALSRQPTVTPTTRPSISPTTKPTMMPSVKPSVRPTVAPTTVATLPPNTRMPTADSTAKPVLEPTRYPVYRPSPSPTVLTGLDATFPGYTRVMISVNGTYNSNSTFTQFIVNATGTVSIMGASRQQRVFTVFPMSQSVAQIAAFNISSDILDLRAHNCHSFADLNVTMGSADNSPQRRFLRVNTASVVSSVSIHFPRSQVIELRGITVNDLRNAQILFSEHKRESAPTVKEAQNKGSNVIPLAVAISVLAIFVLYTLYNSCSYYSSSVCGKEASVTPLTVDMERKQNRTFVTYIDTGDDWLDSFQFSSSDSSSSGGNHNSSNIVDDNSSGVSSVVVSSEESSSVDVSPLLSSEEEYEEKSDEGGSHNGATNGHHFQFQQHTNTVVGLPAGGSHISTHMNDLHNNNNSSSSSACVKVNQSDSKDESDGKSSNGSDGSSRSYISLGESYCLGE